MNHFARTIIVLASLLTSVPTFSDAHEAAERAALRALLESVETAINEQAFDRLIPLLDEGAVVVFLNGEVTRGIDEAKAYFDKTLGSANPILSGYHTEAEVGAPARFVGAVAMADGSTKDTFVFATGNEMDVHTKWTVTANKQGDSWKIMQLQFSSNIFENPLVESAKNNLIMFTVVAVVVGIVVGFFLGRRRRTDG